MSLTFARSSADRRPDPATPPRSTLWRWPVALGLATASGLVTALLSDGWGDVWSWLALGAPLAVIGWHVVPRPTGADGRPTVRIASRERR